MTPLDAVRQMQHRILALEAENARLRELLLATRQHLRCHYDDEIAVARRVDATLSARGDA